MISALLDPEAVRLDEIVTAPPVLLAGEDHEEPADPHIVRGID